MNYIVKVRSFDTMCLFEVLNNEQAKLIHLVENVD